MKQDFNDGAFWMPIDDFVNNFRSMSLIQIFDDWKSCSVEGEWNNATSGGCMNLDTFENNIQFLLKIPSDTQAMIYLQ